MAVLTPLDQKFRGSGKLELDLPFGVEEVEAGMGYGTRM